MRISNSNLKRLIDAAVDSAKSGDVSIVVDDRELPRDEPIIHTCFGDHFYAKTFPGLPPHLSVDVVDRLDEFDRRATWSGAIQAEQVVAWLISLVVVLSSRNRISRVIVSVGDNHLNTKAILCE